MKKTGFILLITLSLLAAFTIGAIAGNGMEEISAWINHNIKIEYNDVEQNMTDANGNPVYPITYNDTTYLPVRAISNMLGVKVDWDNDTQTVLLGESYVNKETENIIGLQSNGTYDFSHLIYKMYEAAGTNNIVLSEYSKEFVIDGIWQGKKWEGGGDPAYTFPQIEFISSEGAGTKSEHLLNAFNAGCKALEDNGYKLAKTDQFNAKHYVKGNIEIIIWNINDSNTSIAISVDTHWQACCTNN